MQDVGSVATNAVKPHLNHPSILLSDGFRSLPERGFSTDTEVPKDRHQTTVLQPAKRRLFAISELGNGGGTVSEVSFYKREGESLSKREIWLKVRVTDKEREIIKRKAARLGMTVSEYVRTALIHSDNLNITMIDVRPIEKIATELHKQGVNLNQLMKFLNTYGADAYNADETFRVLTREGDMFLKVSDVLGQLCDEAARKKVYSVGGYHWYYKYKGEPRTSELKGNKHKTIECIETGEVFRSITEAARKYGTAQNTISEALKNDYALFGRYHFRYIATSDSKMRTVKEKRKMLRQVVNLETGKRFNSVREAAEVTGYSTGSFYPVLRCTARKLGGHHWMYADEYDLLSKEEIAHIVKHGGRDDL